MSEEIWFRVVQELNQKQPDPIQNVKRKYEGDFLRDIATVTKQFVVELYDDIEKYLNKVDLQKMLNNEGFGQDYHLYNLAFTEVSLKLMRKYLSSGFVDKYRELLSRVDIFQSKDLQNNLENMKGTIQHLGLKTREEINFIALLVVALTGIIDLFKFQTVFYSVHKYLEKNRLNFNYKKFVMNVGINNMDTFLRVKETFSQSEELTEVFNVALKSKSKEGDRGCPFILYENDIVVKYMLLFENFLERLNKFIQDTGMHVTDGDYAWFRILMKDDYSYDRYDLLDTGYVTEIK